MTTLALTRRLDSTSAADAALHAAVRLWFVVAVTGQLLFVLYIAGFYGGSAVRGDFQAWNKVLSHGYVAGQTLRNIALSSHLLLAALMTLGGALQLVPIVRARFPRLHRWIGRIYIPVAFVMAVSGVYLIASGRKIGLDVTQQTGLSVNALLIMFCSAMTWRYAVARNFATHRRWALRLFLVVNGAWFVRVGLMFWVFVNGTSYQFNPRALQGPLLSFLSFAQYLLPLAILELYLVTRDRAGARGRFAMAALLSAFTVAMSIGIVSATRGMWLPHL